jgi:hypothetical protein
MEARSAGIPTFPELLYVFLRRHRGSSTSPDPTKTRSTMRLAVTEPSSPPIAAVRRPIDLAWASLVILVPVVVALLSRMGTTDLTYHVRAGDGILSTHSLPRFDTYTFSVYGRPWLDQQWGAQIVLALGHRYGGWATLAFLQAVLVGASFWFVYLACRARRASVRTSSLLTVIGFLVASPTLAMRPQLVALPLFAVALWALASREIAPRRLYLISVLAAICANVHGSFTIFPLIVGLAWIQDARQHVPGSRRLLWVALATVAATLLNPFGVDVWRYAYDLSTNPIIRDTISEWAPVTATDVSGLFMIGSALAVVAILARRSTPTRWTTLLWLGVFFLLAMSAQRAIVWWAMVAPVVLAELFPAATVEPTAPAKDSKAPAVGIIAAMLVAVMILLPWWRPNDLLSQAPPGITAYVLENIPSGARMFVHQPWGSWFEYRTPDNPVFVDSRIEIIPKDIWDDYGQVGFAGADWREVLARVNPDVIIAADNWDLLPDLEAEGSGWTRVYQDDDGEVFVRS